MAQGPASAGVLGARRQAPGIVLYPKPAGVTSHDLVAEVRRLLGGFNQRPPKVGHAGTLDPFATGLVLLLVGQATRAQRFLMALPKTYRVLVRLGWRSDTGDRDGRLDETGRVPDRIEIPVGTQQQRPPAYSAVKVGGERLYRRARRGDPVEGAPRPVTVHRAEVLWRSRDRASLEIECSAGTYVRQLVASLGDAYCEQLERTRIGPFRLEDADPERVVALGDALAFLPERALGPDEADDVVHGRALDLGRSSTLHGAREAVRLTSHGELLAIAEPRADKLQPVVVIAR